MKYAIYVVVIEDTEENDLAFGDFPAIDVNRAAGDLELDDAMEIVKVAADDVRLRARA